MRPLLFLLLLTVCVHGHAQDRYLALWGGGVIGGINLPTFDAFRGSYDTENAGQLSSGLSGFGTTLGWQAGATVMISPHVGVSLGYMENTATASATLTDGSSRHFRHKLYTPVNGGFPILAGPLEIQPRLGFCQADMSSWTEYPDGTVSYGNERLLNGQYRTYGLFAGLDLAARIKLGEKLHLAVGASWCGVSGSEYSEHNTARGVDTEPFYPYYIPTDYGLWLDLNDANDLTSYDTDAYVKLKGSWYQAFVNLIIDLK